MSKCVYEAIPILTVMSGDLTKILLENAQPYLIDSLTEICHNVLNDNIFLTDSAKHYFQKKEHIKNLEKLAARKKSQKVRQRGFILHYKVINVILPSVLAQLLVKDEDEASAS